MLWIGMGVEVKVDVFEGSKRVEHCPCRQNL